MNYLAMITPQENQGQIVEVSYGALEGVLYRRTYDASDRSESWERATAATNDDALAAWDEWSVPEGARWQRCEKPTEIVSVDCLDADW